MIWENEKTSSPRDAGILLSVARKRLLQARLGTGLSRKLSLPFSPSTAELQDPSRGTEAKSGDTMAFWVVQAVQRGLLGDHASDEPPPL